MTIQQIMDGYDFILTEAAVIETLRHSGGIELHPRLQNAQMIYDAVGQEALSSLYQGFIQVACNVDIPIMLCTPTWRANQERTEEANTCGDLNGDAVRFLKGVRQKWGPFAKKILIGGMVGCKNDCYRPDERLSTNDAGAFHCWQIDRLAEAGPDFLLAATLPSLPEAAGIAMAMAETDIPYVISFVINREGRILDGHRLESAFGEIDTIGRRPPLGYMINCAYPSFLNAGHQPESVLSRLIGYQANASSLDHAELDGSDTLHADDLSDWGDLMVGLNREYGIKILGGCCGTDKRYLQYITERISSAQAEETP